MKVIITIAAGRRLSMSGLIPQLLAQEGWDEMHVWVNTTVKDDIDFLFALPKLDSRIKLKFLQAGPEQLMNGELVRIHKKTNNLGDWWSENCTDPDAIYVRFDDDIVFVEKDTVKELVAARLKYPDPYLIFPVIINNGVLAHHLEKQGKLKNSKYESYTPYVFDPLVWSAEMCFDIHKQFLDKARQHGVDHFHIPNFELTPQHISINCMVYFGRDIAAWGGKFGVNAEEGFITCQVPFWNKRNLMIYGNKVVSHMAFHSQRSWWESQADDQDVNSYITQLKMNQQVQKELEQKYANNSDFREQVNKKVGYHNSSLEILQGYRALHGDLYGIEGYPVVHPTWDWDKIHSDIEQYQQTHAAEFVA